MKLELWSRLRSLSPRTSQWKVSYHSGGYQEEKGNGSEADSCTVVNWLSQRKSARRAAVEIRHECPMQCHGQTPW